MNGIYQITLLSVIPDQWSIVGQRPNKLSYYLPFLLPYLCHFPYIIIYIIICYQFHHWEC